MEKELLQLIQIQTKYFNERKKDYKEINQEKTNTLNVMLRISENNIIKKFIDEEFENIISTLKKYQNKRIGEKTKIKIENEIKSLNESFEYVHFYHGHYSSDDKNWPLSIELKNENYPHSRVNIKLHFTYWQKTEYNVKYEDEYTIDINGYNKEDYILIENIEEKATEIIKEYELLKKDIYERITEINKNIDCYREKYPSLLRTESQEVKHVSY